MKNNADVLVESPLWKKHLPKHLALIQKALDVLKAQFNDLPPETSVSIVLADNAFIQTLNATYRGKDKPTNVLSFPAQDENDPVQTPELGDIVLAYETIAAEAKDQGKTLEDHVQHLVIHGFLHLLGYDHTADDEATIMEGLEIQLLKKLGIANPYDAVHQHNHHH